MEQQNQIQSLEDEEPKVLEWNEASLEYTFGEDGLYRAKGLDSAYTTIATLKRAWRLKTSQEKLKEALKMRKKSRKEGTELTRAEKVRMFNKSTKELEKWANP